MTRTRLALAAALLAASAASPANVTTKWGPNGNGTLAHQDDVRWLDLRDTKVIADTAAGRYIARFDPLMQKMEGQEFVITGYMMPVAVDIATNHSC